MIASEQHAAIHAITMRLQSLSLSLHQHRFDGPELVSELLRCATVALDIAEEAAGLANRLEDDALEEELEATDGRIAAE